MPVCSMDDRCTLLPPLTLAQPSTLFHMIKAFPSVYNDIMGICRWLWMASEVADLRYYMLFKVKCPSVRHNVQVAVEACRNGSVSSIPWQPDVAESSTTAIYCG